jgi:hypothetical protein
VRRAGIVKVTRGKPDENADFGTKSKKKQKKEIERSKVYAKSEKPAGEFADAVAKQIGKSRGHMFKIGRYQAMLLFFLLKMARVLLLSRAFFSPLSFFADRPDRTDRASEIVVSSMYLSL